MIEERTLREISRRLEAVSPAAEVVVFGSHARGEAGPRSDLDLLVIVPAVANSAAESVRLRRSLRGLGLAVDLVVMSQRDVDEWRDVRGSFVRRALTPIAWMSRGAATSASGR